MVKSDTTGTPKCALPGLATVGVFRLGIQEGIGSGHEEHVIHSWYLVGDLCSTHTTNNLVEKKGTWWTEMG